MSITGPQARAARALVEWPRDHVATLSDLPVKALASFERRKSTLEPAAVARLRRNRAGLSSSTRAMPARAYG